MGVRTEPLEEQRVWEESERPGCKMGRGELWSGDWAKEGYKGFRRI